MKSGWLGGKHRETKNRDYSKAANAAKAEKNEPPATVENSRFSMKFYSNLRNCVESLRVFFLYTVLHYNIILYY